MPLCDEPDPGHHRVLLGGLVFWHLTTPEISLAGRLAGGLFVYALSVPEAYRLARLRSRARQPGRVDGTPARL